MEQIIIYGAGNTARFAYDFLSQMYDVYCFIDGKNPEKWGTTIYGKKVCSPEILREYRTTMVVIASNYAKEILPELKKYHLTNVHIYQCGITRYLVDVMEDLAEKRTIDLGKFFHNHSEKILCKELTFTYGGSGVLDYMFIKSIAEVFHCKRYLEIGSYIGESINILTDCCEELYSITAPLDSEFSMRHFCEENGIADYSGRLIKSPKIVQYHADSKLFDYSQLPEGIDLFFIDGDHSYEGVYSDTRNIFSIKAPWSIVIWHDAKNADGSFNAEVLNAIHDALGSAFENFYVTDHNMCDIYLPDKEKSKFPILVKTAADDVPLYTYDVLIENYSIH